MSLNKDKRFTNLSISSRLVIFYSISIAALISVFGLLLYTATLHTLHKANYEFLSNEVDIVKNLLSKKIKHQLILQHKVFEVPSTKTGSAYDYYIRVLDDTNHVVIETPEMTNVFQDAKFFNQNASTDTKEMNYWHSKDQQFLLFRTAVLHKDLKQLWQIQIALDISFQQKLLHEWKYFFLLIMLMATLISLIIGFLITRNGLKSLYELSQKTQEITASSLHQKLHPDLWPSEIKQLGEAFNEMLARIEYSFSQLNQFSADLAHELRTPINNIMGQTEIALGSASSIENLQNVLASNLEEMQRISQIIDNLLFLARAENQQIDFAKTLLNIADEARVICEFYQSLADEKNVKLDYSGNGFVYANSIMFRRMLSNLVSNSLKYTEQGGTVEIRIDEHSHQVSSVAVIDNGIGIAEEHVPYIFNRFYRTDEARSQHSGGTGLGLAIVKSIVELHRGFIEFSSLPQRGTTVTVTIPH